MRISIYLLVPVVAWLLSQILKYALKSLKLSSIKDVSYLYSSGDMPSSHAALMVALATTVGFRNGLDSVEFGIVFAMTIVVLYDALNVRRSVGEQALALKKVLNTLKKKDIFYAAKGHTLSEVLAGAVLGFITAVGMLQFL